MIPFYSLWDVDSGNSLGTYATEEDALAVVRELLRFNGAAYADVLDLGHRDAAGGWEAIATGQLLVERAQIGTELPVS